MSIRKKKILSKNRIVKKEHQYENSQFYILYGLDLDKRRIFIDDDFDEVSMGLAVRAIHKMIDSDPLKPIDIYINSYGGSIYDCLSLYDTLRSLDNVQIRTFATGKIMSAGFVLFLAGDERRSTKHASFMMHSISGGTFAKLFEVETDTNEIKRLNHLTIDILAERTGQPRNWWAKQVKYEDKYYDREDAKSIGVVTHD